VVAPIAANLSEKWRNLVKHNLLIWQKGEKLSAFSYWHKIG
jgi:hypothetical protein